MFKSQLRKELNEALLRIRKLEEQSIYMVATGEVETHHSFHCYSAALNRCERKVDVPLKEAVSKILNHLGLELVYKKSVGERVELKNARKLVGKKIKEK